MADGTVNNNIHVYLYSIVYYIGKSYTDGGREPGKSGSDCALGWIFSVLRFYLYTYICIFT